MVSWWSTQILRASSFWYNFGQLVEPPGPNLSSEMKAWTQAYPRWRRFGSSRKPFYVASDASWDVYRKIRFRYCADAVYVDVLCLYILFMLYIHIHRYMSIRTMSHGAWTRDHGLCTSIVHGLGPWSRVHAPWFMVHRPWAMVHSP